MPHITYQPPQMFPNPQFGRQQGKCQLVHSVFVLAEPPSEVPCLNLGFLHKLSLVKPGTNHFFSIVLIPIFVLTGHLLGVVASWAVQVGINIYGFLYTITKSKNDSDATIDTTEEIKTLGKKVYGTSVRCVSSLVFASIGAGIGATLIRPSTGQWVGMTP